MPLCMNRYYLLWIPSQKGKQRFLREKALPRRPNRKYSTQETAVPGRRVWTVPPTHVCRAEDRQTLRSRNRECFWARRVLSLSFIHHSSSTRLQTPATHKSPYAELGIHPARTNGVLAPGAPSPHLGGGPQTRTQRNRIIISGSKAVNESTGVSRTRLL